MSRGIAISDQLSAVSQRRVVESPRPASHRVSATPQTEGASHPGGMPEISRWLSAATPPVIDPTQAVHPGGIPGTRVRQIASPVNALGERDSEAAIPRETSGIPPGCDLPDQSASGGVATLNHRLIAVTPSGSIGMRLSAMQSCLIVWILPLIGISFARADDVPSSAAPATVARLVADLANDSRAVRTQAEADLIQLGPPVIDLLPTSSTSDPAVRDSLDRVIRAIDQAEFASALTPKTVHWTKTADLREAIQQLATASGNSLDVTALDPIPPTEPFPTQPLTFWEAIDWIEQHTPLRYEAGQLQSSPSLPRPPASLSGPFRIQLIDSTLRTTPSGMRLLGVKLRTTCEPRLRPLFLMAGVDDWAVTHDGISGSPFTAHARREIPSSKSGEIDVAFDFTVPESITDTTIWTLKGHVDLTLAARSTRVTFSDLTAQLPLTRRRGQASLSLLSLKSSEGGVSVRVASAFPEMSGLFESYRAALLAPELTLESATGKRLTSSQITQVQEDPQGIVIETRFESVQRTGARLHARVPTAISTQKIDFEFPRVALSETTK